VVRGEHAFIADGEAGLAIVDVSEPGAPKIVGTLELGGFVNAVEVAGDFAFVTDEEFGVRQVLVKDPKAPVLVSSFETPGEPTELAVTGNHVIVNDAFSLLVLRSR
jgi:hypothetical protein